MDHLSPGHASPGELVAGAIVASGMIVMMGGRLPSSSKRPVSWERSLVPGCAPRASPFQSPFRIGGRSATYWGRQRGIVMGDLRSLRDDLDRARTAASQDPTLENSHRSFAAWQALQKAVQAQGPNPSFLSYQLKGDSSWLVQVLWPDGFEEYGGRFPSELDAQRWIDNEAPNWLTARERFHKKGR